MEYLGEMEMKGLYLCCGGASEIVSISQNLLKTCLTSVFHYKAFMLQRVCDYTHVISVCSSLRQPPHPTVSVLRAAFLVTAASHLGNVTNVNKVGALCPALCRDSLEHGEGRKVM